MKTWYLKKTAVIAWDILTQAPVEGFVPLVTASQSMINTTREVRCWCQHFRQVSKQTEV